MYRKQRLQTLRAIQHKNRKSITRFPTGKSGINFAGDKAGVAVVLVTGSAQRIKLNSTNSGRRPSAGQLGLKGNVTMVAFNDIAELTQNQDLEILGVYVHKNGGEIGCRLTGQDVSKFSQDKSNSVTQSLRTELLSIVNTAVYVI